jgi:hypothetical protein
MATIDPSIALSIKPVQIQDPLNRMAAMMQLEGGQQTQQLNALKIREAEQDIENRNALRNIPGGINDPDYISNVAKYNPELAVKLQKDLAAFKTSGLQTTELQNKIKEQERNENREAFKSLVFNPSDNNILAYLEDSVLKKKITPEQKEQQWATVKDMTPEQRIPHFTMLGTKADEFFKQQALNEAPTTDIKNFQYGLANPAFAANLVNLKRAGAASTQVYMPPQPKAEQEARGKFLVDDYKTIATTARNAAKTLPAIDTNLSLLDKGFKTGFTTETQAGAASILSALGIPDAKEFATNAQIFNAKTNDIVLQKQLDQKGVQTANDTEMIKATGARLGNTSEANRFLLDIAKAQLKRDIDQRNYYDKWWEKNKTYDGAENAWYASEGDKSLFERPELKKYKIDTSGTPSAAPSKTKSGASVSNW